MSMDLAVASALKRNTMRSSTTLVHLAEALPDGIMLLDTDWRLVYANRSARSLSGIEDRDLHRSHWDIWPETLGTPLETLYRRSMTERQDDRLEAFYFKSRAQWLDLHLFPVEGGMAIYYRDITEERRSQKVNADAAERSRLTLSAADGIGSWKWDLLTDLVHADFQFAELHGIDRAHAALGVSAADFVRNIHAEDADEIDRVIHAARRNGGKLSAEYRIQQPSGQVLWVAVRGQCTLGEDGSPLCFSGIAVDISSRKRTEAALIQSEKLAAVGRMASSIAHEINNPLESVTNLLFLAQQYAVSPEVKRYLSLADQELARINVIANQTLRFHKQATVPRSISPEMLFSTVLNLYDGRLRNSGIIVRRRMQPDLTFFCFEGDIRQVLNNLVSNAIDAMPNGGILQLRSHRTRHPETGRIGVALTVADTGTGIAAEHQPLIFDAFFTTKGGSGNGLGLWISKGILDRQQGLIRVRSRCGTESPGTVFSIFLPAAFVVPATASPPRDIPFVAPQVAIPAPARLSN